MESTRNNFFKVIVWVLVLYSTAMYLIDHFGKKPEDTSIAVFDSRQRGLKEIARIHKDGDVELFFGTPPSEAAEEFWKIVMTQKLKMTCVPKEPKK